MMAKTRAEQDAGERITYIAHLDNDQEAFPLYPELPELQPVLQQDLQQDLQQQQAVTAPSAIPGPGASVADTICFKEPPHECPPLSYEQSIKAHYAEIFDRFLQRTDEQPVPSIGRW
jgi:hypothetical protein